MQNSEYQSLPVGVDGKYLGACAKPSGLFTRLSNPRNLRVVPRRTNSRKLNKLPGFLREQLWDPDGADVFYEATEAEVEHA